jgi:hypothetical protein
MAKGVNVAMAQIEGLLEEMLIRDRYDILYRPKIGDLRDPDANRWAFEKLVALIAEMKLTVFEALLFLEAAKRNLLLVNKVALVGDNAGEAGR